MNDLLAVAYLKINNSTIMKRTVFMAIAVAAVMTSCGTREKLEKAEEQNVQLNSELQATLATQDSLFALINDITAGMGQIKDLEHIIATPGNGSDARSQKDQLRNDMVAFHEALQQRRDRLAQLEEKLRKSGVQNSTLTKTIENLKAQIAEQETEMATLRNQLSAANVQIASLGQKVDSLSSTVSTVTTEREVARQEATQLNDELNTCYYAVGNKSELQKNKIIQTGFLRKTKILEGDFEKAYFIKADKRTLNNIPLHSKKAEVMTKQPAASYSIEDQDGQKVLVIKDPTQFWEVSNFLVVKID